MAYLQIKSALIAYAIGFTMFYWPFLVMASVVIIYCVINMVFIKWYIAQRIKNKHYYRAIASGPASASDAIFSNVVIKYD